MIKVRPSQVFDFDTEDLVADGGQRTSDTSPAPTIDDRANLYLNAVYGAREFKGEEYAGAGGIILKAMTIDVEAARKDIVEDCPAHENSVPSDRHHAALPNFQAFEVLEEKPDAEAAPVSRGPRRILPRHNARVRSCVLFTAIAGSLAFVAIATLTLPFGLPNTRAHSPGPNTPLPPDALPPLPPPANPLQVLHP